MRIVENTRDRLVLRHSPWLTSGLCLAAGGGSILHMLLAWPDMGLKDVAMMTGVVIMSGATAWFFGRWIELRFVRHSGQLTMERRLLPFLDLAMHRRTIPLQAISQVELQSYLDDIRMWRVALVTDPARLPPEPRAALARRERLRKIHILLSPEGTFPMVPFYTSSKQEWTKVRDAVATWLGIATAGGTPSKA